MRAVRFAVLLFGLVCGSLPALAADKFPNRPIKFVVGFLAGGPNDIVARIFCDWLQPHLGQPCVVENKDGQGGMMQTIAPEGRYRASAEGNPRVQPGSFTVATERPNSDSKLLLP